MIEPMPTQPASTRAQALAALHELASGRFHERMRREAAGRVILTARQVAELADAGALGAPPGGDGALGRALARWRRAGLPLAAFVATLAPAELAALLEEAPEWAEAVCAGAAPAHQAG